MSKVSKIDNLTENQKAFAEGYEALKKDLKKADTSVKKVLKNPESEYHDASNNLERLALAKILYEMLAFEYEDKTGDMPVKINENTVQMVNDLRESSLIRYFTGADMEEQQEEEEEEDEELSY